MSLSKMSTNQRQYPAFQKDFKLRGPIRPFIASTYEDFRAERSLLTDHIFPEINKLCHERFSYFAPIDLRCDQSCLEKSNSVLLNSLDYIGKCFPFFICILGERYGPHRHKEDPKLPQIFQDLPEDATAMDKNLLVAKAAGYDWLTQDVFQYSSPLELQIVLACFLEETEHCFCYFRQSDHIELLYTDLPEDKREKKLQPYLSESPYAAAKMNDLKTKIVKHGKPHQYFTTPKELASLVLQDWKYVLDQLYPPLYDTVCDIYFEEYKEWMHHETFAETRRQVFLFSPDLQIIFAKITRFALIAEEKVDIDPEEINRMQAYSYSRYLQKRHTPPVRYQSILALIGDRGSGKTSILSNWIRDWKESNPGLKTFVHYVGCSTGSTNIEVFMRRVVLDFRGEASGTDCSECDLFSEVDDSASYESLFQSFVAALSMVPCVIVIDGIDELKDSTSVTQEKIKELGWLTFPLPPQCKVILSTTKSDSSYLHLRKRGDVQYLNVPSLVDSHSKEEIIKEHLGIHFKDLTMEQRTDILNSKMSNRALYLSTLANELKISEVYQDIDDHIENYGECGSVSEFWKKVIRRWIFTYSWKPLSLQETETDSSKPNKKVDIEGWITDAFRLIVVSKYGLTQNELLDILKRLGYSGEARVTLFDWLTFRAVTANILYERPGGLLAFYHQHLKEGLEYALLGAVTPSSVESVDKNAGHADLLPEKDPDRKTFHGYLGNYFLGKPHSRRRTRELPWHLYKSEDFAGLAAVLADPLILYDLMQNKYTIGGKLDLIFFWKELIKLHDFDPGPIYVQLVKNIFHETNAMESEDSEEDEFTGKSVSFDTSATDNEQGNEDSTQPQRQMSPAMKRQRRSASRRTRTDINGLTSIQQSTLAQFLAIFLMNFKKYESAEEIFLATHERLINMLPLEKEEETIVYETEEALASVYELQGKKDLAAEWYAKSLRYVEGLLENFLEADEERRLFEMKSHLLGKLGNHLSIGRQYAIAQDVLNQSILFAIKAGSIVKNAAALFYFGSMRFQQKDYTSATDLFMQTVSIRESWFGKAHHLVAEVLYEFAKMSCVGDNEKHDKKKAELLFRRTLITREATLGMNDPTVADTLFELGCLLKSSSSHGAMTEALILLRRSLDIRKSTGDNEYHLTSKTRHILSELEYLLKKKPGKIDRNRHGNSAPHSGLSWQDTDLLLFEHKARMKENQKKMNAREIHRGRCGLTPQFINQDEIIEDDNEDAMSLSDSRFNEADERLVGSATILSSKSKTTKRNQRLQFRFPNENQVLQDHKNSATSHENIKDKDEMHFIPVTESIYKNGRLNLKQELPENKPTNDEASFDSNGTDLKENVNPSPRLFSSRTNCSYHTDSHRTNSEDNFQNNNKEKKSPNESEKTEYLDSFTIPPKRLFRPPMKIQIRKKQQTGGSTNQNRPKTAPVYMFQKYRNLSVTNTQGLTTYTTLTKMRHSAPPGHRVRPQRMSSADVRSRHRQSCYVPGPHTIDLQNAYSVVNGPNSTLDSLMGPKPCPRETSGGKQQHHRNAWYNGLNKNPSKSSPIKSILRLRPTQDLECFGDAIHPSRETKS